METRPWTSSWVEAVNLWVGTEEFKVLVSVRLLCTQLMCAVKWLYFVIGLVIVNFATGRVEIGNEDVGDVFSDPVELGVRARSR